MQQYIQPILFCIFIGVFLSFRGVRGRVVPYREVLIEKNTPLLNLEFFVPTYVWILKSFNEESRLYRMIQYFHSHYGLKQVVIIPNESKVSSANQVPVLEFFQKMEILVALTQAVCIFSEAGVAETAVRTAKRIGLKACIFLHDTGPINEVGPLQKKYRGIEFIYTSRWTQQMYNYKNISYQVYLPVFPREFQTHTSRERVVCVCPGYEWKFQQIAAKVPQCTFLYAADRINRVPLYTGTGILCILDQTTNYEIALEASASQIPIVAQWSPILEEVLQDYCILLKSDAIEVWAKTIKELQENMVLYQEYVKKSLKLSQLYDSSEKMDKFLNFVKSAKLISSI
jgi:hypothetical protein